MNRKRLVAALLLLATVGTPALAAESPEHQSQNARKVVALLGAIGITDPQVKELIYKVDSNVDDKGYYTLMQEEVPGGTLKLHYELGNGVGIRQLEVQFAPEDSNWRATVRTREVRVNYRYTF